MLKVSAPEPVFVRFPVPVPRIPEMVILPVPARVKFRPAPDMPVTESRVVPVPLLFTVHVWSFPRMIPVEKVYVRLVADAVNGLAIIPADPIVSVPAPEAIVKFASRFKVIPRKLTGVFIVAVVPFVANVTDWVPSNAGLALSSQFAGVLMLVFAPPPSQIFPACAAEQRTRIEYRIATIIVYCSFMRLVVGYPTAIPNHRFTPSDRSRFTCPACRSYRENLNLTDRQ